jgi:hypothetical protein
LLFVLPLAFEVALRRAPPKTRGRKIEEEGVDPNPPFITKMALLLLFTVKTKLNVLRTDNRRPVALAQALWSRRFAFLISLSLANLSNDPFASAAAHPIKC